MMPWLYYKILNDNVTFTNETREAAQMLSNQHFLNYIKQYYNNVSINGEGLNSIL